MKVRKFAILNKFFGREPLNQDFVGIPEIFTDDNLRINMALQDEIEFVVIGSESDYYISKKQSDLVIERFERSNGKATTESKQRGREIRNSLSVDYFNRQRSQAIHDAERGHNPLNSPLLTERGGEIVRSITGGITGEEGRALFLWAISISAVKDVCPEQDIRLHKNQRWANAVSMRTISSDALTSWMNANSANVSINSFGPAMTRTFSENIPWVPCYPPDIKGPKDDWLELIDGIHYGRIDAGSALRAFLYMDFLNAGQFDLVSERTLERLGLLEDSISSLDYILPHISSRNNGGARLLEIAIHSFAQCVYEHGMQLCPSVESTRPEEIKSMRSADRKAGGVGDIQFRADEYRERRGLRFLKYSIDCKYNIPELSREIARLRESIHHPDTPQPHLEAVDFIGIDEPTISGDSEVQDHLSFLRNNGVSIRTFSLADFVRSIDPNNRIGINWLRRYASMLMKEDLGYGIVTEVSYDWLDTLQNVLPNEQ